MSCQLAAEILRSSFSSEEIEIFEGNLGDPEPSLDSFEYDYLISFLSPWIVSSSSLVKAKKMAMNFHPGSPLYPGIGCYNFALYEESDEYGVTCHEMVEKVDKGNILSTSLFPLQKNDSVESLKIKSMNHLLILFQEKVDEIALGKEIKENGQSWERKPFKRKELNELCFIDKETMDEKEIGKRFRATEYVAKWGPYEMQNGEKILLSDFNCKFPNL